MFRKTIILVFVLSAVVVLGVGVTTAQTTNDVNTSDVDVTIQKPVDSQVFVTSYDYSDNAVNLEIYAKTSKQIRIYDGFYRFGQEGQKYDNTVNLEKGTNSFRIENPSTVSFGATQVGETYGIILETNDNANYISGNTANVLNVPLPSSRASFWIPVIVMLLIVPYVTFRIVIWLRKRKHVKELEVE